jgi:hypothetical protein
LQNPTAQLAGLGLLAADRDWTAFDPLTREVTDILRQQGAWGLIEAAASPYLSPKRVEKLLGLAGQELADGASMAQFVCREKLSPVKTTILKQLALRVLSHPSELAAVVTLWQDCQEIQLSEVELGSRQDDTKSGQAIINLLFLWHHIESTLKQPILAANQSALLLDVYEQADWYKLDFYLGQLPHLAEQAKDAEISRAVDALAFGEHGDDQAPDAGSLKDRVRAAQHQLDECLASLIRPSPDAFISGTRCSAHYLRTQLRAEVDERTLGNAEGKVWVLIFDGMRFDTWRFVVRPILAEHFTIQDDRPHYCVPPSFTAVARTSLLAGSGPKQWQGFQGQWTGDEFTLAARNFGLTQPEAKAKLRLQKEAETLKARGKLNKTDSEASIVNILIYGISDECHEFYGDFGSFQEKIRHDLLGNRSKGVGGILDDMLRRIGPDDEVAVISDHGFTELLTGDSCLVPAAEVTAQGRAIKDDVQWRYTAGFAPKAASNTVAVDFNGETLHMAVGRQWFRREGTKQAARYAHGGCTLAEMVVPAARMKRVTGKSARATIQGIPELIIVPEDTVHDQAFQLRNIGTVPVDFSLEARTNLGENLIQSADRLGAGESRSFTLRLFGRYRQTPLRELDSSETLQAVTLRLRHTNLEGALFDPPDGQITLSIQVKPKATKLDTDALAGLDDL